jgi:hypothetical protein
MSEKAKSLPNVSAAHNMKAEMMTAAKGSTQDTFR